MKLGMILVLYRKKNEAHTLVLFPKNALILYTKQFSLRFYLEKNRSSGEEGFVKISVLSTEPGIFASKGLRAAQTVRKSFI